MNDDLAFCLQTFVAEQRSVLESTRIKQENAYHIRTIENKTVDEKRQQLQDKLIVLAQRVFAWLQVAVNICYDKIRKEINDIFVLSRQTLDTSHIDRLVMLLVTVHSESKTFERGFQWPPPYFTPIFHESIATAIQCYGLFTGVSNKNGQQNRRDNQSETLRIQIESIGESIMRNQTIRDANQRYSDEIRTQKKKVDDRRHPSQGDQSETLETILELLSKTIDNGYKHPERYIQSGTWNRQQQFWTNIMYEEFSQSIRSYDQQKCEQREKKRRQLERRQRANQARVRRDMLQLSSTLRILALGGSQNQQDIFQSYFLNEQKLDHDRRKTNVGAHTIAPVIFGRVDDTSNNALPITVTLDEDYDSWKGSDSGVAKKAIYIAQICKQLNIPDNAFKIERVEAGSTIVYGKVLPPYGKLAMEYFSVDDAELENLSERGITTTITLGRFGLNVRDQVLFPKWNRVYDYESGGTHWVGSLNRAGKPYYCPVGWTRFAIKVTETQEEFDERYSDYYIAYHGTKNAMASDILNKGLQGHEGGCYREGLNIYLSPSIEYAAHPRYATPWERNETGKYYQMVLQCRVNPRLVKADLIKPETLLSNELKSKQIDPNFSNGELEWILPTDEPVNRHDLICYGLMIRITSGDPANLLASSWWKYVWWEHD